MISLSYQPLAHSVTMLAVAVLLKPAYQRCDAVIQPLLYCKRICPSRNDILQVRVPQYCAQRPCVPLVVIAGMLVFDGVLDVPNIVQVALLVRATDDVPRSPRVRCHASRIVFAEYLFWKPLSSSGGASRRIRRTCLLQSTTSSSCRRRAQLVFVPVYRRRVPHFFSDLTV